MMRRRLRSKLPGVAFSLLFAATALPLAPAHAVSLADPANAKQVVRGAQVYADHCAACHGKNLEGQPNWRVRGADGKVPAPPHDFHGHTWHHSDQDLFRIVKQGIWAIAPPSYKSDMVGFGSVLSDPEIWAVLAFIKSKWPPEFQVYQRKITEGAVPRQN